MARPSALLIGAGRTRTLVQTVIRAQLELPADQWALGVDGAAHAVAVERGAPSVIQASHYLPAPVVFVNEAIRNARIGQQQHFEATAACGAGAATDTVVGELTVGNKGLIHRGSLRALRHDSCKAQTPETDKASTAMLARRVSCFRRSACFSSLRCQAAPDSRAAR